jgi:hypothetical protein
MPCRCGVEAVLPAWSHIPLVQVRQADMPGDVMTPFGMLNRTTSEAQVQAAVHVVPFTPRTRARSDQFNPEAEHALLPRSLQPDATEHTAGTLFECVVPYAEPGAQLRVSDHGDLAPSGSKVHPLLSLKSSDSSDGGYE